jgi:ABC-type sugar transport system substrate-binding protein
MRSSKRKSWIWIGVVIATVAAAAGAASVAGAGGEKAAAGPLEGKKILLIPYWLDNFGIAYTHWLDTYIKAAGGSSTAINANAVTSKQLNVINTAVNTGQYQGLVWEPIDQAAAATTVNAVQNAKIAQVVFQGVRSPKWSAPVVSLDETHSLTAAGVIAAKYIKSHPKLGPRPLAAFMGVYPQNSICVVRMKSFLNGLRSVTPSAKVVYFGSAKNQADSARLMSDFINTHKAFNVTNGCGSASTLGVVAALNAAGLGGASRVGTDNKVPEHVFVETQDGTPPELQYLWDKGSAVMVSSLLPAKDGAKATVPILIRLVGGSLPLNSNLVVQFGWKPLSPNCQKYRPEVLAQFAGVPGFKVPKCSFRYTGSVRGG